jgi:hydrogenase nickel incorporation protein HypB
MEIKVLKNVLKANETIALENRRIFKENRVVAINILGSPGAGKTTLLEKSLEHLNRKVKAAAIIGDIATSIDAQRLKRFDIPTLQIETAGACHLDANMVKMAISNFNLKEIDILFIENVGNLVCPSGYNLGEEKRVVVLSVSEGDDKPLKYPNTFLNTDSLVISKIDLLPYTDFDLEKSERDARSINPEIKIFKISAKEDTGFKEWIEWILEDRKFA